MVVSRFVVWPMLNQPVLLDPNLESAEDVILVKLATQVAGRISSQEVRGEVTDPSHQRYPGVIDSDFCAQGGLQVFVYAPTSD